jgi:hypothetical protein
VAASPLPSPSSSKTHECPVISIPMRNDIGRRNLLIFTGQQWKQIKEIENSFVVSDEIEIGFARHIPIWIFGLLYKPKFDKKEAV